MIDYVSQFSRFDAHARKHLCRNGGEEDPG